jgi:outer membrane murein-binding lipoprotein Lpp
MLTLDHGIVASLGAVVGGIITRILSNQQKRYEISQEESQKRYEMAQEEAKHMRHELRNDVQRLQAKVDQVTTDLDQWRERYFKLSSDYGTLTARCKHLEIEVDELRKQINTTP